MQTTKVVLIMMICATALSACGLKGPLYLPADEPQPSQSVSPDEAGNTEAEGKKKLKKDQPQSTVTR